MFEDVIFTNSFYNDELMTVLKSNNNELMFCCNYIDETTVVVLNREESLRLANAITESLKYK